MDINVIEDNFSLQLMLFCVLSLCISLPLCEPLTIMFGREH